MVQAKKNVFQKIFNCFLTIDIYKNFKEDTDKWFFLHFIYKSLAIAVSLFLSFITPVLNFLPALVCIVVVLSEKSYNRLYYFIFLTPFWFVFDWILLVYGVIFLSWGLKYIRDLINKQVEFNWKVLLVAIIPIVYVALPIGETRFDYIFFMATFSFVLFFVFTYREHFNFKRFVLTAVIAIIISIILGFVGFIFDGLYDFSVAIRLNEHWFRFSACNMDCNFLGSYLAVLFASITYLYLRKEINTLFLCLIPVFTISIILTGSKLSLLMYAAVVVYLLISVAFRKDNWKNKLINLALITGLILVSCLVMSDFLGLLFGRFEEENIVFSVENNDIEVSEEVVEEPTSDGVVEGVTEATNKSPKVLDFITAFLSSKLGLKLSSITSYRVDLWFYYLNDLLLSPLSFIFGKGEGAERLFIRNTKYDRILREPHNSMVDLVYYLGIIFLAYFIFLLIQFIRYRKKQGCKFNKSSIMVMVTSFIVCCSISVLWSYVFVFLILNATLCMFEVPKGEGKSEDIANQ